MVPGKPSRNQEATQQESNGDGRIDHTQRRDDGLISHSRLCDNDVLLGRGTGPNDYSGNISYRRLVREVLNNACFKRSSSPPSSTITMGTAPEATSPEIDNASNSKVSSSEQKLRLARQIVLTIKSRGGRFLERVISPNISGSSSSTSSVYYGEVGDGVAIEKTKQSFRHQMRHIEEQGGLHQEEQQRRRTAPTSGGKKRRGEEDEVNTSSSSCLAFKHRRLNAEQSSNNDGIRTQHIVPPDRIPADNRESNMMPSSSSVLSNRGQMLMPPLDLLAATSLIRSGTGSPMSIIDLATLLQQRRDQQSSPPLGLSAEQVISSLMSGAANPAHISSTTSSTTSSTVSEQNITTHHPPPAGGLGLLGPPPAASAGAAAPPQVFSDLSSMRMGALSGMSNDVLQALFLGTSNHSSSAGAGGWAPHPQTVRRRGHRLGEQGGLLINNNNTNSLALLLQQGQHHQWLLQLQQQRQPPTTDLMAIFALQQLNRR